MARRKAYRRISMMPAVKGFQPYGPDIDKGLEAVRLHFEEYEAFRLCDYELYNHVEAAVFLNVSRPTFTRIYSAARNKIAKAFVEGRPLVVEGGMIFFDHQWYECIHCGCKFHHTVRMEEPTQCPLCGGDKPKLMVEDKDAADKPVSMSYCIACGFESVIDQGSTDTLENCPRCNKRMRHRGRKAAYR